MHVRASKQDIEELKELLDEMKTEMNEQKREFLNELKAVPVLVNDSREGKRYNLTGRLKILYLPGLLSQP